MIAQLTDREARQHGPKIAKVLFALRKQALIAQSGVMNVSSGMLRVWYDPRTRATFAEVYFRSCAWTGR